MCKCTTSQPPALGFAQTYLFYSWWFYIPNSKALYFLPCYFVLFKRHGFLLVPSSSVASRGIQTNHVTTIAEVLRKCTKQLSLPHSILSYIFRNIVIRKNNAICSFSQSKSYSATNVQQQFCIPSARKTPAKLIYNAILYSRDYPDISVEQDYKLLSSQHKKSNILPHSASPIKT